MRRLSREAAAAAAAAHRTAADDEQPTASSKQPPPKPRQSKPNPFAAGRAIDWRPDDAEQPPPVTPDVSSRELPKTTATPRGPDGQPSVLQRTHYPTPEETAERRMLIYQLLNAAADPQQIAKACAERFAMSEQLTKEWIDRVRRERSEQFEADRPRYKSEQVSRLQADLTRMRSQERKPWAAIARHEQLLSAIVGTREPIGVHLGGAVQVREALVAVIQQLEPAALDEIVAEQLELVAAAEQTLALRALPAASTTSSTGSPPPPTRGQA